MRDEGLTHTLPRVDLPSSRGSSGWGRVRLTVLACWLLLAVTVVGFGERTTSLAELDAAVSSGRVGSVRIEGGLTPGTTGYGVADVHWRTGPLRHVTTVVEASRGESTADAAGDGAPVVRRDLGARLQAQSPGLQVARTGSWSSHAEVAGFRVPSWVGMAEILLGLTVLGILVFGPEPWRATRWAWFWIMAASGVGLWAVPVMLALSGPTPLVPSPRRGSRLTAGWALIGALVVRVVAGRHV